MKDWKPSRCVKCRGWRNQIQIDYCNLCVYKEEKKAYIIRLHSPKVTLRRIKRNVGKIFKFTWGR